MDLSIIIPVYNEINLIEKFCLELKVIFKDIKSEFIFIDDGSDDGTKQWLNNNIPEIFSSKKFKIVDIKENQGKGFAIKSGLKFINGKYILLIDSDLEYDPQDGLEMLKIAESNSEIKVLFGSRYVGGKIQHRKHIFNDLAVRLNTLIFNFLFDKSISDLHCGTKLIHRDVFENIELSINDFGFEIDISSKIAKSNYNIYEYGISYIGRTSEEGKKITGIDGLLSYYYLFKTRFIENDFSTFCSTIYASILMGFIGSFFGMGLGKTLMIIFLTLSGLMIGLKNKIFSTSILFLSIYIGSLFSKGNGRIYTIIIFFLISLYLVKKINNYFKGKFNNKFINLFI